MQVNCYGNSYWAIPSYRVFGFLIEKPGASMDLAARFLALWPASDSEFQKFTI